jgi:thermitase
MAIKPAASVNDPSYSKQLGLCPRSRRPPPGTAPTVAGVTIAILDTGVDSSHPDLKANMFPAGTCTTTTATPRDVNGHGTKVAGTAAMVANNGSRQRGRRLGREDHAGAHFQAGRHAYWSAPLPRHQLGRRQGRQGGQRQLTACRAIPRSSRQPITCAARVASWWLRRQQRRTCKPTPLHDSMLSVAATDSNDARASFSKLRGLRRRRRTGVSIYSTTNGGWLRQRLGHFVLQPCDHRCHRGTGDVGQPKLTPADIDKILKSTALDLGSAGTTSISALAGSTPPRPWLRQSPRRRPRRLRRRDTQAPTISIASPTAGSVSGSLRSMSNIPTTSA